ncbi:MAG: single-stranded-DNA-specific exonuclease RecJ [Gemmatimonadetes bacterium]|nr:single-stranded-DNA-specific exonuclease RecJ [Gemmatimonadota bacterium]
MYATLASRQAHRPLLDRILSQLILLSKLCQTNSQVYGLLKILMRRYPVWNVRHDDPYDSLIDALLAGRGLTRAELQVGPEALHPPEQMQDMATAVARLERAVRDREKIVVYGDYDVDGVCSTAVLMDFLERVGADCDCLLPDRHKDGYGLKPPGVERAIAKGARVIVTVDNGISAYEALELAAVRGVEVVVADHHQQLAELPRALAIINPNRRDCTYPFKDLAGVGVTFKLVQALSAAFLTGEERRRYLNELLDLVALGTVADLVPVLGENRLFIQRGLQILQRTQRLGLRALKKVASYRDQPLDAASLGFRLGPRINVAGRLKTPDIALRLLRSTSEGEAAQLADELNRLNSQRQAWQREGIREVEEQVGPEEDVEDHIIVVRGKWNLGIIGLLASKLCEKYARPAVVCTQSSDHGLCVGSARSIPGYDISAGIHACEEHLKAHGGHPAAAGFSLEANAFERFRLALIDHANAHISPEVLQPALDIDLMLKPADLTLDTVERLAALEPFGNGHRRPVFALEDCRVVWARQIGSGRHFKAELEVSGRRCAALWWNQKDLADQVRSGDRLSAAFELEADTYTGNGAVQMVIKDLYLRDL